MAKKIIFTGGGTMGHVTLNLKLIPVAQKSGITPIYIGSKKGIEKDFIKKETGIKYCSISSGKLRRYLSGENLKDIFKVSKGIFDAYKILKKEKPDVVFSKGGFVTVPVVIASKILNIKTVIHESDYTPGLANKVASKFASKIYTTFEETTDYLPDSKTEYIGTIKEDSLSNGDSEKAYELTGFEKNEKPTILITGGSTGSLFINQFIWDNIDALLSQFNIIHLTGKNKVNKNLTHIDQYKQFDYVTTEFSHLLALSDIVISRAGSNMIFELLSLNKLMLLIPLSKEKSRGDQLLNAKHFQKHGYAEMIEEEALDLQKLLDRLELLSSHSSRYIDSMNKDHKQIEPEDLLQKIMST